MYMTLDMAFNSAEEAQEKIGGIKMYYVGTNSTGHIKQNNKRYREYILLSKDIAKLGNITNALDGSTAFAVDTDKTYVLSNGNWVLQP